MKKYFTLILLFFVFNVNAQEQTFYEKYELEYLYGNKNEALKYLKLSLSNSEQNADYLLEAIGDLQLELNYFKNSAETYEKLLKLNPKINSGSFFFRIGSAYYFSQDYQKAIKYLEKAYDSNYNNSGVPNNLGWCYSEIKNYKKAIKYFKIAYTQNPTYINNINNLGYAYYLANNFEKAKEYILKAKSIDSNNTFVYRNLGLIAMKQGLPEIACENLNISIEKGIIEKWGKLYIEELIAYCKKH